MRKKTPGSREPGGAGRPVRMDDGSAFIPEPTEGRVRASDDLAENLAEGFVSSATSGEESSEDRREQFFSEEIGGPFVETTGDEEFELAVDEQNPEDAGKEPFPTARGGRAK